MRYQKKERPLDPPEVEDANELEDDHELALKVACFFDRENACASLTDGLNETPRINSLIMVGAQTALRDGNVDMIKHRSKVVGHLIWQAVLDEIISIIERGDNE